MRNYRSQQFICGFAGMEYLRFLHQSSLGPKVVLPTVATIQEQISNQPPGNLLQEDGSCMDRMKTHHITPRPNLLPPASAPTERISGNAFTPPFQKDMRTICIILIELTIESLV